MAKKRLIRKKKKPYRLLFLTGVFLILAVAILALVLLLSSDPEGEEKTASGGDALWDGGWYEDDLEYIRDDRALVRGMKAFEKRTGVKPYLSLLSEIDPQEQDYFARQQYEALFSDGDHLLVVYNEWGEDTYYLSAQTGSDSKLTEADTSLLLSYLEAAYASPEFGTYSEAFGAGFDQGGQQIAAGREKTGGGVKLLLALGVILVALSIILILVLRKRARDIARRSWGAVDDDDEV